MPLHAMRACSSLARSAALLIVYSHTSIVFIVYIYIPDIYIYRFLRLNTSKVFPRFWNYFIISRKPDFRFPTRFPIPKVKIPDFLQHEAPTRRRRRKKHPLARSIQENKDYW